MFAEGVTCPEECGRWLDAKAVVVVDGKQDEDDVVEFRRKWTWDCSRREARMEFSGTQTGQHIPAYIQLLTSAPRSPQQIPAEVHLLPSA